MADFASLPRPRHSAGGKVWGTLVVLAVATVLATRPGGLDIRMNAAALRSSPPPVRILAPSEARQALVDNPTDDALLRVGVFAQPLVPIGPTRLEENRELAKAIVDYVATGGADAVDPLVRFLTARPTSVWKPALLVDLGDIYRKTGHFSKALETWQTAWDISKTLTNDGGRAVGDAAVAALSQFEAYLGRKEALAPLLDEVKRRAIRGTAAELVSESMRGLAEMLTMPESSFKCGPLALSRILAHAQPPPSPESLKVLDDSHSTAKGLSLSAVRALSVEAGMNFQMAFRASGAPIITPAVAHWKVGHYAAVLTQNPDGRYQVEDATFGDPVRMRPPTLDEEASGYFLVPPGPLPPGWRTVEPAEGDGIWGRGDTGSNKDNSATRPDDTQAFPSCDKGGGCTNWNVAAMVVGLTLHDDPVGYTPPIGPDVRVKLYYSHRDVQQPITGFYYGNFGPKWTNNWLSYVTDTIATTGSALLTPRGGGGEAYAFFSDANSCTPSVCIQPYGSVRYCFCKSYQETFNMNSLPGPYTQATLERLSDPHNVTVGFQRRLSDGSIEWFTQPGAMPGSTYAQWFLTMVVDPQGNAVTINYDSKLRITSLTSADGLSTTFSYDDLSTDASKLRVTKVTDPFGRSARFVYDSQGRLSSITDVLGIQSTYIYLPDTSCLPSNDQPSNDPVVGPDTTDFICALKTPYGTTKFSYTNDTAPPRAGSPSRRSVTIVDALGRTSRVEYRNKAPGIPDQDPSITVPGTRSSDATDGIATTNLYLSFRNTFIWDWYQYNQAGGDTAKQSDTLDYSKAKLIHWLHLDDNSNDRVMESSKEPLENRIWYDYAGQTLPYFRGTSNQPRHVGRVLPNGRTQLWTYAYNGFGHVTKATDPLGRQTTYVYDVNGVDLLSVSNTTPQCSSGTCSPASDLLATMTYNAQHGPLTVTGANGQTTHYTYNDRGQLATTTDALGHAWSNDYDVQGHLLGIYRPTPGRWWQSPQYIFSYDGRVTNRVVDIWYGPNTTDPSVTVTYDDADRVTSRKYLDGSSEQFGYTLLDLTSSTNRWGGITHLSYYPDRTVQYITDPSGNVSTYYYSPNGRVSDIWYPTTPCTGVGVCSGPDTIGFTRDLEGRVTATSYPDLTQNDIVYDAAGRIDHDSTRTFTYSDDGTVARIDYPAQSGLYQNFFYDSRYPRVTQISRGVPLKSWVDSTSHVYSPVTSPPTLGANRLSSVGTFSGVVAGLAPPLRASVSYVYDELDRVQTRTVWDGGPNGVPETFTYDEAGNVASVTNALDTFTYSYDELSRLTGIQSLHGPQGWVAYFPLTNGRRQEALGYMDSHGQYGVQFDYTYHANLITAFGLNYSNQLDPGGPSGESWWYYGYDGAKRLTGTNFVPPTGTSSQVTYTYDPHGNIAYITGVVRNGAANWGYYTPADQSSFMSYDSQGNPTALKYYGVLDIAGYSHGPEQYTWNAANQLTKVTTSAGESDFGYDQAGHLQVVTEQVAGTVVADRRYMWCGGTPCLEYDWLVGRGASKRYFAQGWVAGDGSKFYYIRDKLGSVRAVVDSNSRLRAKYDYDPYGLRIKVAGDVDSDIGFAGYFHHGRSGFDFTVNRGYDPRFGRWLNRDPIGIAGGLDLYRYADSDPVNLGDPSGLCPACVGAGVGFVAGGLFGAGLYAFTAPTSMSWGQFLSGAADAFQTGALAGALGGSGGAFLGTIAGGGTVAEALGWAMANGVDSNTNLAGEIFGDSSAGAGQLRILQTGGNTIKQATADALNASNGMNLSRREWGRALEALKTFLRLSNDFHGAIDSVGNLRDPATGEILGNMLEHCP